MKLKEIDRTANVTWSPAEQYPVYLAAGTAAQQLDATFSTSAALEIYKVDLSEPGIKMRVSGSITTDCRFHKLVWGCHGMEDPETPSGYLVGGADNGSVFVWNPAKLLDNQDDPLVYKLTKHTGAVAALDVNPFQTNLLASGGSESEIFIWDLNNPTTPMTPGSKSQPPDDVTSIAWNRQVQHILASTYAGRCVVWDLRKNEPIIKVSDSMSRIKCKLSAWHPEVATQMCLASEDDHSPVIQLWDLRFATSPLKTLEGHQRGILSVAWCSRDPDLLLSCGKDNRILCWNPNSQAQAGEVVYELPTSHQWTFDVQWCPRNPGVISTSSFDGHISVYSLMGSAAPQRRHRTSSNISDSFLNDPFSQQPSSPHPEDPPAEVAVLRKAPKWLCRPVGASFGFGGKLVCFENSKSANPQQPDEQLVNISQVVTETELVSRSNQLEHALSNGQYSEFCALKIANCQDELDQNIWNFLKVHFETEPRSKYLQLLGFDEEELAKKVTRATQSDQDTSAGVDASELAQKMALLNGKDTPLGGSGEGSPYLAESQMPAEAGDGNVSNGSAAFDQIAMQDYSAPSESPLSFTINEDCDGLVTQALLMADFQSAVDVCLHSNKMAEAIILAIAGGPELLERTQKAFFQKNKGSLSRIISSVVTQDFESVMQTCDLENWKEALAMALTYAKAEEFTQLCEILGQRLEQHPTLAAKACLCYICAGSLPQLVSCLDNLTQHSGSPDNLQDLVEKVMILQKAVELRDGCSQDVSSDILARKLSSYAGLLAGQGNLSTALMYLSNSTEISLALLRDRLFYALSQQATVAPPPKPFQVVNVQPEKASLPQQVAPAAAPRQPQQQLQQQQQQQQQQRQQPMSNQFYQTQANSTFETTTTSSSTYYNPNQYTGQSMGPTVPTFSNQQPAVSAASYGHTPVTTSSGRARGPLGHKYPSYPQTTAPYDPYSTPYSQPGYTPNSYSGGQSATSQPAQMYDQTGATVGLQPMSSGGLYAPSAAPSNPYASAAASNGPAVPSYQENKPSVSWNDPPILKEKKKEIKYEAPAPITQPVFGVPTEQTPPDTTNYGTNQVYNPQAYQQQQQQQQPQQQVAAPSPAPPKSVVKPPVPPEHQVLEEVFNKVVNQCLNTTNNPQIRRKLEDVLRKLELLYDKLRDQSLSPSVIMGLHQIILAIQQYDYQTGLAYHTQMISQGNFSEICSFMPGVKMLLQTAMQLQVYVQ